MLARVKSNFVIFDNLPYVVVNVRFFIKSSFIIQICPFYYTHTHKKKKKQKKNKNKTKQNKQTKQKKIYCAWAWAYLCILFSFLKSICRVKISKFFKKKKKIINQNYQFHEKIQDVQIFQKKKKKSSLNSSSWTESYDPLPYFTVVQHQVNCPPSAFFEAWSMSQTRGIRQVCQILFNE